MKRNAEQLERLNAQLTDMAHSDALTGLFNHRHFREALDREIKHSEQYGAIFSLIFMDIDHFKNYNDTHGHLAGDALLKQLAGILRGCSRGSAAVTRYGGEEFVLLLPDGDEAEALALAERLRATVEGHPFHGRDEQPSGRVTMSLGVATFPRAGKTATELLDNADKALYRSKGAGRNQVTLWDPSFD
jgi:diguanylate cyclase (GGDEF)-like protein